MDLAGVQAALASLGYGPDQWLGANATFAHYDGMNRLRYEANALGGVTEYRYDGYGNILQRVDYHIRLSLADITAIANLEGALSSVSSSAGLTTWLYDALNRPQFKVDPAGYVTEYRYGNPAASRSEVRYTSFSWSDAKYQAKALTVENLRSAIAENTGSPILSEAPLGLWRFDETSGYIAENSVPGGKSATVSHDLADTAQATGLEEGGVFFDGSTRIDLPHHRELSKANPRTIEIWVNKSQAATGQEILYSAGSGATF